MTEELVQEVRGEGRPARAIRAYIDAWYSGGGVGAGVRAGAPVREHA
jgi:hypothetical protein